MGKVAAREGARAAVTMGRCAAKRMARAMTRTLHTPAARRGQAISNRPAAPMPPPMHIVTTAHLPPRRLPSISA